VNDVIYDVTDSLQNAALGDLLKLKVKTKTPEFKGVTVRSIQESFTAVGERMTEDGFEPIDLLGDEDFLRSMAGLIFLARRNSGEQLEVADAFDTRFSAFRIEPDDDELEVDEGPKDFAGAANVEPS